MNTRVFGPSDDPAAHAGALVVGDARLLAPPARSFRGTLPWTTSPLLLTLAKRDLEDAALPIPSITGRGAQLEQLDAALSLADVDEASLPSFPTLGGKAGF